MNDDEQVSRRLIVNAIPLLNNLAGVGHVTAEISKRLNAAADFDAAFYTPFKIVTNLNEIEFPDFKMRLIRKAKQLFRMLPFKNALRDLCTQVGPEGPEYDLYWEPNFIPNDSISARRIVTTVHDMSFHEHPEWHPKDRVSFFSRNFFNQIGRSDIVVTVSEFSRQQFLASQSEIGPDRVRVIPCGINHSLFRVLETDQIEAFRKRMKLPERFVLFVGSIEPRKNLTTLLAAYEMLPAAKREAYPLVLVGDAGWNNREIHQRIKALGRGVRAFGYLERPEDLALMYNAASVFAYLSLYEGFGIPPLEAMACGTPVCLSSIPVFHEVYGEQSACYVDPHHAEPISAGLTYLMENQELCSQLVLQGLRLAQRYTWDRAYEQYEELFKSLL